MLSLQAWCKSACAHLQTFYYALSSLQSQIGSTGTPEVNEKLTQTGAFPSAMKVKHTLHMCILHLHAGSGTK